MNLLLIQPAPKNNHYDDSLRFIRNFALRNYFMVPSLALGILAALTPPEWKIRILQEPNETIDFSENYDLVGITAVTNTVRRGYEIADQFRGKGVQVVMGGIHPSALPEEALQHCDAVCIGEAELIWNSILTDAKRGSLKKIYKAEKSFDLQSYPLPRRDLMPKCGSFFYSVATVETSRGCPYNCEFCSVSISHGNKIRCRPYRNLISEIEKIQKKRLFFVDNNIVADKVKAKKLFNELAPLGKKWTGQASISIADDVQLTKAAADSGCYGLLIGIESVTDEGFKKYKKSKHNFKELKNAVKILKEHGIAVYAHMVFGNDFDTKDSFAETLERLSQLDLASATLGILVPYPGTVFTQRLEQQKRIVTKDWNLYDIHHLVFNPANFSESEFIREIQHLRQEFFSYRKIFLRALNYRNPVVFGFNLSSRSHNRLNIV